MIDSWRIVITGACFTLCNICCFGFLLRVAEVDIITGVIISIISFISCIVLYLLLVKTALCAEGYQKAYEAFKAQVKLTTESRF